MIDLGKWLWFHNLNGRSFVICRKLVNALSPAACWMDDSLFRAGSMFGFQPPPIWNLRSLRVPILNNHLTGKVSLWDRFHLTMSWARHAHPSQFQSSSNVSSSYQAASGMPQTLPGHTVSMSPWFKNTGNIYIYIISNKNKYHTYIRFPELPWITRSKPSEATSFHAFFVTIASPVTTSIPPHPVPGTKTDKMIFNKSELWGTLRGS